MNMSRPFVERPVMTTLIMMAILIFGVMAFRLLPVNDLPNVDFPTIQVSAGLPGASPETMAAAVATPLERQFSMIDGLDSMVSANTLGVTLITLQFSLRRNLDAASQDIQAAISRAQRQLPVQMPAPPSYSKVNPALSPILFMVLTSPTLPLSTLDEYGETMMSQRISMVDGVAQVMVYGSQVYAVRVQLDPDAMAAKKVGLDQVGAAITGGNVNLPTGVMYGRDQAFTLQANGQLFDAASFRELIVTYRNGAPVRLKDVGRVLDSVQNDKVASWYYSKAGSQRALMLAVQRQPGTNTVQVTSAVKALLPIFRKQLPASVDLQILYDRSQSIRESVNDVEVTLLIAVVLVILVIFFFLRSLSATIIPSLALPFSIVGTFAVMSLFGYSLNNLSLMALTLSIGFLVDDAIVMLENIFRHQELGEGVREATLNGSREIGFTILSMTLSLAAVFLPILFMGGILGRLLHEFAVTIAAAVLISGVVSLSLTPLLSSRILKPLAGARHGRLYVGIEKIINGTLEAYKTGLRWSLKHRRPVMLFSAVIFVAMVVMFTRIPKGFIPSEDTGQFNIVSEAAQGISFDSMVRHQQAVAELVIQDPDIAAFSSSLGGISASNTGRMFILARPRADRTASVDQIIERLRPKVTGVTGINVFLQNPPPIQIGGRIAKSLYQYTLQSPDTDELYQAATAFEAKIRSLSNLQDVTSDMQLKNPQVTVQIDRDMAQAKGVSALQIEDALYYSYGQRQVSTIYTANNQYWVIVELDPRFQSDPALLSKLYISSSRGTLVPLDSVAKLTRTIGPLSVNHSGQLPSVTISFNLKPGVSLGDAVNEITQLARETLPSTVSTNFQGTAQAFQSSLQGLGVLLIMTILVIYIILGILYESFIHPLTILSALPFAGFGALATLLIFRTELSIYGYVGVIMLVGLVKKNGIMMIDFALSAQRDEGKNAFDSIFEACVIRFRPIMMTTLATLFGTLPIALGFGAGAEARRPLGLAVVGGLLFSQLVTLFVTPVVFTYLDRLSKKKKTEQAPLPA